MVVLVCRLHYKSLRDNQQNSRVVEQVFGLHHRNPIVVMLKVGLHDKSPMVVTLKVGLHYG